MTPETRQKAFNHAIEVLKTGKESCGLVIIEKGFESYVPCKNISDEPNTFVIDPIDYAGAEDRGEIVRIVHSHPYSSCQPSEVDRVSCEATKLPWSIVSVPKGDWFDFDPTGFRAPLVGREWGHRHLDCYSLIRDYYSEVLNIQLMDFEREFEWWLKGDNLYLENFTKAGFREVPIEQIMVHDLILMQVHSPVINHGGVYLGNEKMLHHLYRRLSCREVYGGYWRKHTVKVIRHESR